MTEKELDEIKAAFLKYMSRLLEDEDGKVAGIPSLYSFAAETGIDEAVEGELLRDQELMIRAKKLRALALISAMLTKRVDSTAAWHIIDKCGYMLHSDFFIHPRDGELTDEEWVAFFRTQSELQEYRRGFQSRDMSGTHISNLLF